MLRDTPTTIYLRDYRPPAFLIDRVDLTVELNDKETLVTSRLQLRRNPASQDETSDLRLDGEGLDLRSIAINGKSLATDRYRYDENEMILFTVPNNFQLETQVAIRPRENTALEGLYLSGKMYCTQCEAEGFRKITWYLDRPDVMARFTTRIIADKMRYPVLLSNGNPVKLESLDNGRHAVTWEDPFPKPAYLFALVAGDLKCIEDRYVTISGRRVDLKIYVEPENVEKCEHAMRSLKSAMAWDERNYGREYDLDIYMIVAVNDFNMGAMENKGLNIFNSKYVLARQESATDTDFQGIEGVIAHEYFHNWTGNRITCRDWFQLSLKEGLTVFRDQEFSADMGSRSVKRIEDVRMLRAHQFAEDASPMAHPIRPDAYIEINNFYTLTVYEKGAEVVRMQRLLLGAERYREATDLYFERHDGQAVTTDDFVQCMADVSGRDLEQFKRWYSQAGTPELHVSDAYDAETETYQLRFCQSCPATPGQEDKDPFHIPVAMGLLDDRGEPIPLQLAGEPAQLMGSRVLEVREQEQEFCFINVRERPLPSLLRGFSAPVKLHYPYSDEQLMFLMSHDSDGFNRWDAAQTLAQRCLLQMVADPHAALSESYLTAFRKALLDESVDKQLLSEVLRLPSESYLGDQMAEVDVDGIHAARERLKVHVGTRLRDQIETRISTMAEPDAFELGPEAFGRRALRNLLLGYLFAADSETGVKLCEEQYRQANNMTDTLAALSLLADTDTPESTEALEAFYQRWQADPLVLDKWFSVQALSKRTDALAQVERLMEHPAFSIRNPNKVRALIGSFCSGNLVRFHAIDGEGYRFLADRVIELDRLNPQVASRMVRLMSRWRRHDQKRQGLMCQQLKRVLDTPDLSRDVYEIVSKSLKG